mmetsp:Transcript_94815/g.198096  ORF Transcript_94815/g.198096 Transcript_94815/m.198096 type:complete len:213 (-) Transcript_94815:89-727(-)
MEELAILFLQASGHVCAAVLSQLFGHVDLSLRRETCESLTLLEGSLGSLEGVNRHLLRIVGARQRDGFGRRSHLRGNHGHRDLVSVSPKQGCQGFLGGLLEHLRILLGDLAHGEGAREARALRPLQGEEQLALLQGFLGGDIRVGGVQGGCLSSMAVGNLGLCERAQASHASNDQSSATEGCERRHPSFARWGGLFLVPGHKRCLFLCSCHG